MYFCTYEQRIHYASVFSYYINSCWSLLWNEIPVRFLFPVLMKRWMNKMTGGGQNPFFREPEPQKKEGEVSITQKPKSEKKHPNQDRGDYVDFEEVD